MATAGVGDTELDAMYKFYDDRKLGNLTATLGLSLPTGSTTQNITMMGYTFRAPYDMQLGSGTFDFKPALTYNWLSDDALWNLGATVSGIIHAGTWNGWAFGNSVKLSSWVQYDLAHDFTIPVVTWYRMTFTDTGRIRGQRFPDRLSEYVLRSECYLRHCVHARWRSAQLRRPDHHLVRWRIL